MCDPVTIAVVSLVGVSGGMKAASQYKEGVAANKYYDYLARQSEAQGEAIFKAGQKQSELIQESAKFKGKSQAVREAQVAGAQKAALAAQGVDLSSVTAQDLASDTMSKARLDELAIRYSADVQSWSTTEDARFKRWTAFQQADQYEMAGDMKRKAGGRKAFGTLIGTAASMAMAGSGMLAGSEKTSGLVGKLKGYRAGTPAGARDMGSYTLLS